MEIMDTPHGSPAKPQVCDALSVFQLLEEHLSSSLALWWSTELTRITAPYPSRIDDIIIKPQ